jgi:hypothetical protein
MEKVVILAFLVTIIYSFINILDMKYIKKEYKPLKEIVKDTLVVFLCSVVAGFITFHANGKVTDFLNVITETKTLDTAASEVFTGEPGF